MIERKLELYLKKVGAHIVSVLGSDTAQVEQWKNTLNRMGFEIEEFSEITYTHAVIVLDQQLITDKLFSWMTTISLCEDCTLADASSQGLHNVRHDLHRWNGIDFEYIGEGATQGISDDFRQICDMWKSSILPTWPDMEPFQKDTYLLYAGAGPNRIFDRRNQDLVEEIDQAFLDGYTKILFYNGDETTQPDSILRAQRLADFYDIKTNYCLPERTFIYVCGAPNARDTYERLVAHYGFSYVLQCRGYFRFELLHREDYTHVADDSALKKYHDTPYEIGPRPKKFLNFNRVPRKHRMMIASKLKGAGLIDQGYMSFYLDDTDPNAGTKYAKIRPLTQFQDYFPVTPEFQDYCGEHINFEKFLNEDVPMVLNRTAARDNPVDINDDDLEYYRNSYFSIVNETVFYRDDSMNGDPLFSSTFLSEKTWKPIMMKHPFVIIGCYQSLDMLRNIGYKTFHPYINEDYDATNDDHSRMEFAFNEIKRLIEMTDSEWLELQRNIAPIIEHNYAHFCDTNKKLYIDGDSIADYY